MNMEQQKMKMSQDKLYEFLTAHDVKVIRIAELMGKTPAVIISNFRHHKNAHGNPRCFSVENIKQLNDALAVIAKEMRGCVLNFGTPEKYVNRIGKCYDPGLIMPMRRIGDLMSLTKLTHRLLGWSQNKRESVISDATSKAYGCISENDAMVINAELLAVAGVLEGAEIVPDENAFDRSTTTADSI